jgi:glycosyltransferase involved in cell wall biosynthesis
LPAPKILYLVTEDWYFCSHRLPIARAARDAGAEVVVAARLRRHGSAIAREGFRAVPLALRRGGQNPLRELAAVAEIAAVYRRARPDLVHHVAMKPVLYGGMAAALTGVPVVVNALTGLGAIFIGSGARARALGLPVRQALRALLARRNAHLIVQNPDDRRLLEAAGLLRRDAAGRGRVTMIRGSGVDIDRFAPMPEPDGVPVAAMVGRILRDKGVGELVEAARLLRARGVALRIELVGPLDPENPAAIPEAALRSWEAEGLLSWRGATDDIPAVWRQAHIAVLPSYREGLPKALLEAAACGRPLVATDVPGCRELVEPGRTGLLVPARDPASLADALARLAGDPALRRRLGATARALVERDFAEAVVVAQTLALYRTLLPGRLAPA